MYDGIEVQTADINSGPSYTIRSFHVTHLKVKVSMQIPKHGFQGVFKFKNKFINLASRKRRNSSHCSYLLLYEMEIFFSSRPTVNHEKCYKLSQVFYLGSCWDCGRGVSGDQLSLVLSTTLRCLPSSYSWGRTITLQFLGNIILPLLISSNRVTVWICILSWTVTTSPLLFSRQKKLRKCISISTISGVAVMFQKPPKI